MVLKCFKESETRQPTKLLKYLLKITSVVHEYKHSERIVFATFVREGHAFEKFIWFQAPWRVVCCCIC